MDEKNQTKSPQDYARQQEDIRANQVYGESSLDRGADRQHHTERPIGTDSSTQQQNEPNEDPIKPKNDKGYDIAPTATNVKL